MHRFLWLFFITMAMVLSGCESSEQTDAKTTPHQVVKAEKPINGAPGQPVASPLDAAKKSAEKAEARTKKVDQEARAMAGETQQPAPTMAEPVVTAEKLASETEKAIETVTDPAGKNTEKADTGTQPASPEQIILEASNGNITFTHGAHAETVACSTCHGEGTPSAFGIDKDIAHKLCKDCHKDGGVGPTGCRECHIK